jgi:hypothetical protein
VTAGGSLARVAIVVATVAALGVAHAGCGADPPELFTRPFDGGTDADLQGEREPEVDPTLGGPCTEDAPCDDGIPCTFDTCDKTLLRCRNVPDDSLCADDSHCNGREKCVIRLGCAPGAVVTCQDDNPCTIDRCVETTKSCAHAERDVDGDGDPDYHCVGNRDCDDLDPDVSSLRPEVCGNFKDDDCDGAIDEPGCKDPANDVCASALPVTAPGTYLLTTVATKNDKLSACTVQNPTSARDIVMKITVPGGAGDSPKDVEIWASAQVATNEVAVTLQSACGKDDAGRFCGHVAASPSARTIARGVDAGTVLYAVVTTQTESGVDVKVDFRTPAPKPANEDCAAPEAVALDTATLVRLIDPTPSLGSACTKAKTGELTYAFTLAQDSDVRIFASTLVGTGDPVVTLRDATCTTELRCRATASPPLFARNLPAGTHVFTVAGTTQLDASVVVKAYPPSEAPASRSCATAEPVAQNTTLTVDLSTQEDTIKNGCLPGGLAAAYDLTLTEPSDVLVIGRFPSNESGAVSLNKPGCTTKDVLPNGCSKGASPQRVSKRNLAAGSYRVVIADELGQTAQLSVLVRPAVPPTSVGSSDNCASAFDVPWAGGFFTGDTTGSVADFNAGCDAPGQSYNGAKDQIMRLALAQPRRVVMDMSGSAYTTILDVREGPACPATEVPKACYVGLGASKSFLDLPLPSGTYWLQVDGFNGEAGPWNLDVRVLPP